MLAPKAIASAIAPRVYHYDQRREELEDWAAGDGKVTIGRISRETWVLVGLKDVCEARMEERRTRWSGTIGWWLSPRGVVLVQAHNFCGTIHAAAVKPCPAGLLANNSLLTAAGRRARYRSTLR